MNTFSIKALSAALLWLISVIFGVVLPYFFWRFSPRRDHFSQLSSHDDASDQEHHGEGEALVHMHSPNESNLCVRFFIRARTMFLSRNTPSLVYCLCGGVFLGVSLLDLIPESRSAVEVVLQESNSKTSYPLAEFMVALGLLLVMIVENLVSECMKATTANMGSAQSHQSVLHDCDVHYRNVSSYRMYVLVLTLSLHSIFEGLAIGLQKDLSTLLQLVVAVSVHKSVISFGVGLPLFQTLGAFGRTKVAIFCALIFCSASPAGCFAGAFVSGDHGETAQSTLASAILQCLATGTFLYVTFLEVIPKEFSHHAMDSGGHSTVDHYNNDTVEGTATVHHHHHNIIRPHSQLLKLVALLIGFGIASGLQFL